MWHRKIIRRVRVFMWVTFLWFLFTFGCLCAPIIAIAIAMPFTRRLHYIQRFVRAADRLCAAMLGFSGRHMLSTELTYSTYLVWMRNLLNEIQPNHCEDSAYEEGAYCKISDRKIGIR